MKTTVLFFGEATAFRRLNWKQTLIRDLLTDWQQPFTILLTQADGVSVVHETVYENRFGYIEDLILWAQTLKYSQSV